jgi:hypothetical protein
VVPPAFIASPPPLEDREALHSMQEGEGNLGVRSNGRSRLSYGFSYSLVQTILIVRARICPSESNIGEVDFAVCPATSH